MRNSFFAWTGRGSVLGAPIRARCERLLHWGARDNVGPKPQFPLESRTMSLLQSFMSMRVLFSPRLDWLIANDF